MALVFGFFPLLLFIVLKLPLTRFYEKSGVFITAATIVHLVAGLHSVYNTVYRRSNFLLLSACKCPANLFRAVFLDSASECYSFSGYNSLYGLSHTKCYGYHHQLCASILRSLRSYHSLNYTREAMLVNLSCD